MVIKFLEIKKEKNIWNTTKKRKMLNNITCHDQVSYFQPSLIKVRAISKMFQKTIISPTDSTP